MSIGLATKGVISAKKTVVHELPISVAVAEVADVSTAAVAIDDRSITVTPEDMVSVTSAEVTDVSVVAATEESVTLVIECE